MKQQINLLIRKKGNERLEKIELWLIRLSIGSLIAFISSVLVLVGLNAFALTKSNSLSQEADEAIAAIEKNREVESIYTILVQKITFIDRTISTRFPYNEIVGKINSTISAGAMLHDISINESGHIEINLSIPNTDSLAVITNNLLSEETFKPYKVLLKSASRNEDGSYRLSIFLNKQN